MRFWISKTSLTRIAAILSIAAFFCSPLSSATDLQILTFPIGPITGEHRIEVDLGVTQQPADLYFDGEKVCVVTAADPGCMVDFGLEPHVHLLEVIRRGPDGVVVQSHQRWVNRPGQESELAIMLSGPAAANRSEAANSSTFNATRGSGRWWWYRLCAAMRSSSATSSARELSSEATSTSFW